MKPTPLVKRTTSVTGSDGAAGVESWALSGMAMKRASESAIGRRLTGFLLGSVG
jgi:hypothetical protein